MRDYVAPQHILDYDEIVAARREFDMTGEIAANRTLIIELRRSLDEASSSKSGAFFQDFEVSVLLALSMLQMRNPTVSPSLWEEVKEQIASIVKDRFSFHYPVQDRIDLKSAETMSKLLKNSVEMAERFSKIHNNRSIRLQRDAMMLQEMRKFITAILPFVPPERREAAISAWRNSLPALEGQTVEDEGAVVEYRRAG